MFAQWNFCSSPCRMVLTCDWVEVCAVRILGFWPGSAAIRASVWRSTWPHGRLLADATDHPSAVSPLQGVFDPGRRGVDQAPELGLELFHFDLHFPGDFAVAEVALDAAAQARDILRFGKIHLEQEA